VRRQLFVTVEMLKADGIGAEARFTRGVIEARVGKHFATFPASKPKVAADWLAECVVRNYPDAAFSKLWFMLAELAGGVIPFGSR
jgi:hypothetical protein